MSQTLDLGGSDLVVNTLTVGATGTGSAVSAINSSFLSTLAGTAGVVDVEQLSIVQTTAVALTNNITTAQNIFGSGHGVISLLANTTYFFNGYISLGTGGTTHTTALGFACSSAPTAIKYWADLYSTTAGSISTTSPSFLDVAVTTATVLNATSTATTTMIYVEGSISTNAATTVTPQVTFSAGPTGTCQTNIGSYIRFTPVGNGTVLSVGNWA